MKVGELAIYNPFHTMTITVAADTNYWTPNKDNLSVPDFPAVFGGVLLDAVTAHPFASTLNERGVYFDGNSTEHDIGDSNFVHGSSWNSFLNPTFNVDGRTAALIFAGIFKETGSSGPSTDALIAKATLSLSDLSTASFFWYYETDRQMRVEFNGSTLGTTAALTAGTPYWIEIYQIWDAVPRWIVATTNISGAAPYTRNVQIDVEVLTSFVAPSAGIDMTFGEKTARGANFAWYLWNIVAGAYVDANNPPGIIRCDHMWADGIGALDDFPGTAGGVDVDETGQANIKADSGTTVDARTVLAGESKKQLYTLTSPAYITGSDTILSVNASAWIQYPSLPGKGGGSFDNYLIYSDGTTHTYQTSGFDNSNYHSHGILLFGPSGATVYGWTLTDLQNLQLGYRLDATGLSFTINISEVSCLIAYEKSGENMGALPAAKVAPSLMRSGHEHTRMQLKLAEPELVHRPNFFQGLLAQPAAAAAMSVMLMQRTHSRPVETEWTPLRHHLFEGFLVAPVATTQHQRGYVIG